MLDCRPAVGRAQIILGDAPTRRPPPPLWLLRAVNMGVEMDGRNNSRSIGPKYNRGGCGGFLCVVDGVCTRFRQASIRRTGTGESGKRAHVVVVVLFREQHVPLPFSLRTHLSSAPDIGYYCFLASSLVGPLTSTREPFRTRPLGVSMFANGAVRSYPRRQSGAKCRARPASYETRDCLCGVDRLTISVRLAPRSTRGGHCAPMNRYSLSHSLYRSL